MFIRVVPALAGIMLASGALRADVVQLGSIADNTLYESSSGNTSNGAGTAMFAGRNSGSVNSIRRAVLRFDFSSIPANATITSASLRLYDSAANVGPGLVLLHKVTQSWGEGTSLATGGQGNGTVATTNDATWLNRLYPGSLWNSPGGDFLPGVSAGTIVSDIGYYDWSSTQLVSDVNAYYADPAANFGWILIGDESQPSTAKRFSTHEETDPSLRPVLTIEYQVPEPNTAALICLGLMTLFRRHARLF